MIEFSRVSRTFDGKKILEDVSFQLSQGIYAIKGNPGCGKTTLIMLMMGLIRPDTGTIRVMGKEPYENEIEMKKNIGFSPTDNYFFEGMSAKKNLQYISTTRTGKPQSFHSLMGLIKEFSLDDELDFPLEAYRKSDSKIIQLIACMIGYPKILIWDEPFFKPGNKKNKKILKILNYARKHSKLIVYSCSYPEFTREIADHTLSLNNGQIK